MVRAISERAHAARLRIQNNLPETPFHPFAPGVWVKREDRQKTGSFKARGAFSAVSALESGRRTRGVVAASTGNHGLATAFAMQTYSLPGRLFVPTTAVAYKREKIEAMLRDLPDAELIVQGDTCEAAEAHARAYAAQHGLAYLSPYNDLEVIAGQGTAGVEILAQAEAPLDAIFVSVGGGGLVGGIAAVLKTAWPGIRVFAASPENDCAMYRSLEAGRLVEMAARPTLSDGTAGGVEPGSITFPLCREVIDEFVLVSEAEIADGVRRFAEKDIRAEGAAGVALAAYLRNADGLRGASVGIVVCGGNARP